mgnify:CR=1 FL=1
MYDKKLVEAFSIRYGWSPDAVLSITADDVRKMTREELLIYSKRMEELVPDGFLEFKHLEQDAEGNILMTSED